jgi:hypothetical protein
MTSRKFATWASSCGLPDTTTKHLVQFAASRAEMKEACEDMDAPPPVYWLADIVDMAEKDAYGISARANGFLLIGGCENGDPIAIDITDEPGSVWYICHETMHDGPVRKAAIRVATDVREMMEGLEQGSFPCDYFDAKDRNAKKKRRS